MECEDFYDCIFEVIKSVARNSLPREIEDLLTGAIESATEKLGR